MTAITAAPTRFVVPEEVGFLHIESVYEDVR
jgi:hypothetical protein